MRYWDTEARPDQHNALAFLKRTPRAFIAGKPGAGKTALGLAYVRWLAFEELAVRRVLVVAPKRVAPQWAASGWDVAEGMTFTAYAGSPPERAQALVASCHSLVTLCPQEFFPELVRAVRARDWQFDLVIFDETDRLRKGGRQGSIAWKALAAIAKRTEARIVMLSGSPRPGTAHELYGPVFILDQGQRLGTSLAKFRAAYLEPDKINRHTQQVYSWRLRPGMEEALYSKIADLYYPMTADLGVEYVVIDRPVELPASVAAQCLALRTDLVLDEMDITAGSQGTVFGKLHQLCQGAVFTDDGKVQHVHDVKLDEVEQIVEEVAEPVIICYWYSHDLERLKARFPKGVDLASPKGLADAKAGKVKIAFLNPASASHGIDGLQQHFNVMIWFTVVPSWGRFEQTIKRIVRSGRTGTARIFRVLATNGLADTRIVELLTRKEREQEGFFEHLNRRA